MQISRREFIQIALGSITSGAALIQAQTRNDAGIPTRPLGKTGVRIPIIGLGGWDIGAVRDTNEAIAIMHEAIDEGLTFFDNCWDYHDGRSEEIMGKALSSGNRREKVFLMTKVCARDYKGAKAQLEESLRRLKTDYLDLWQFHGIKWDDDPQLIFDEKNGALRAALEAREQGKVRFIGFTGHKDPKYHLAMLARPFEWDTVQMPINLLDAHYHSFQKQVLPECYRRGIGAIGMKGLGGQGGIIVRELGITAEQARRFALSLPISSLICGIQSRENLRQDIRIARSFLPMTPEEIQQLAEKVAPHATDGRLERYKTGNFGCDWYHNQLKRS